MHSNVQKLSVMVTTLGNGASNKDGLDAENMFSAGMKTRLHQMCILIFSDSQVKYTFKAMCWDKAMKD